MLAELLLDTAVCSEPDLSVHLAVSENRAEWPPHGPPPRFTSCTNCQEIDYSIIGLSGRVRIDSNPILRIAGKHVARLGLAPKLVPFDRAAEEQRRVRLLRSILGDFVGMPNPRERIAEEQPDLYRFLERYPKYWSILAEEEEKERRR